MNETAEIIANLGQHIQEMTSKWEEVKQKIDDIEPGSNVVDFGLSNDRLSSLASFPFRVIHIIDNPSQSAARERDLEIEELRKQNQKLKAKIEILEAGSEADISRAINTAVNSTTEIEKLTKKLARSKQREENILKGFRESGLHYREVCYLLTGWLIDDMKDGIFRISNIYAESKDDNLFFEIQSDGTIELLENAYSYELNDYITNYLVNGNSFPSFLAAITLDLFKQTTQASSNMSTTMIQDTTVLARS